MIKTTFRVTLIFNQRYSINELKSSLFTVAYCSEYVLIAKTINESVNKKFKTP